MECSGYKRVILKLSGEALAGDKGFGVDYDTVASIANEIKEVVQLGTQVAVVVGGGNIWRGAAASRMGMDRSTADYVGMLATVMNAMVLQDALESIDVATRVQSAVEMRSIAEPYIRRRAIRHLEKGRVVIFGAGTGNPFFSTDSTAALRAAEIEAEIILMGKKVNGVYDCDPVNNPDAKLFRELSFIDILNMNLKVMDSTAATLCKDNNIPIVVFNLLEKGNIKKAVSGEPVGTLVRRDNDVQ